MTHMYIASPVGQCVCVCVCVDACEGSLMFMCDARACVDVCLDACACVLV